MKRSIDNLVTAKATIRSKIYIPIALAKEIINVIGQLVKNKFTKINATKESRSFKVVFMIDSNLGKRNSFLS